MKKHLEFAGIQRVQTDLDYTHERSSQVIVTFAITGTDVFNLNVDDAQRELIEVINNAIRAHITPPPADFTNYDRLREGIKIFDWEKHLNKVGEQQ